MHHLHPFAAPGQKYKLVEIFQNYLAIFNENSRYLTSNACNFLKKIFWCRFFRAYCSPWPDASFAPIFKNCSQKLKILWLKIWEVERFRSGVFYKLSEYTAAGPNLARFLSLRKIQTCSTMWRRSHRMLYSTSRPDIKLTRQKSSSMINRIHAIPPTPGYYTHT